MTIHTILSNRIRKKKSKSDSKYMLAITLPLASPMSWLSMLEYHEVSR